MLQKKRLLLVQKFGNNALFSAFGFCFFAVFFACTPAKLPDEYKRECKECEERNKDNRVLLYVDTFIRKRFDTVSCTYKISDIYIDTKHSYFNIKPECFRIYGAFLNQYPNNKSAEINIIFASADVLSDFYSFYSDIASAARDMLEPYEREYGHYLVVAAPDRMDEYITLQDAMDKVSDISLTCGQDSNASVRFKHFFPCIRKEKGETYGRKEFMEEWKTNPDITKICAAWKPHLDTIKVYYPRYRGFALYDCYCVRRDTLLTQCQIDSLIQGNKGFDFEQ